MTLDPQAKALLDLVVQAGRPAYHTLAPAEARRLYRETRQSLEPPRPEVAAVLDRTIPGPDGAIPVRIYRPLGADAIEALPVLVFYHGGGWVIGDLDTHDTVCRMLANQAGCAVMSVDYRMGPEHKFPAAIDDAVTAMRWAARDGRAAGFDTGRIAVGGDSAGGNLAAVAALTARDAGGPKLAFQLLVYPATDLAADAPSHQAFADGYLLTRANIHWFMGHYLRSPADAADWRASPIRAATLRGLPPALVITAGFDPLRDEGKAYADRLRADGVSVEYKLYPGQIHGFFGMGGRIDAALDAVALAARALKQAFSAGP